MARNGLDYGWKTWMFYVDRFTSRLLDGYVVNSESVAKHLAARQIPAVRIHSVLGALGDQWSGPLMQKSNEIVVAMIGNRRPEKNQIFGLRAFVASEIEATLRIYTDDGEELRKVVESEFDGATFRLEIVENHRLAVDDYDRIDILLHPSLSESVPRVILEAISRGCYVLAANVGDTATQVDAACGRIIDGYDVVNYANALHQAVATIHQPYRRRDVRQMRTTVQYVDELESLVTHLMQRKSFSVSEAD